MALLANYDNVPDDKKALFLLDAIKSNPDPSFAELRAERPILIAPPSFPGGPPIAVISRFRDVEDALAHWSVFTVRGYAPKMDPCMGPFMLARDDTPLNEREKSIMLSMLPREDLPMVRQLAELLTDAALAPLIAGGTCEVVSTLSRPVPVRLIGRYFGFPGPDEATMLRWSKSAQQDIFHNLQNNPTMHEACVEAGTELRTYLTGLFAERRAASNLFGSDDTVSRLLRTVYPREIGWNDERLISNVMGLLIGGVETTSAAIAQALDQLLARPDALGAAQAAAIRGDDKSFDAYVWEALRFFPINPFLVRVAVSNYLLAAGSPHVTTIPAGSLVLVGTRSAMQDGDVLPDPQTFKLDRPGWAYMHFGSGPHVCLGKYVGMMLVPAVLKQLLRHPNLRRADNSAGQLDFAGGDFPERLTVKFG